MNFVDKVLSNGVTGDGIMGDWEGLFKLWESIGEIREDTQETLALVETVLVQLELFIVRIVAVVLLRETNPDVSILVFLVKGVKK